jgi:hypothetical protein
MLITDSILVYDLVLSLALAAFFFFFFFCIDMHLYAREYVEECSSSNEIGKQSFDLFS